MTAWETYVEDGMTEAAVARMSKVTDALLVAFFQSRLKEEVQQSSA